MGVIGRAVWMAAVSALLGCSGEIGAEDGVPTGIGGAGGGATGTGGLGGGAGSGPGAAVCTSGSIWTGGNEESPEMNPGMACIHCHASDEGPDLSIAGTLYPTAHEPDLCNGAYASGAPRVVITGANGQTLELEPNRAGNFFSEERIAIPYTARVVYLGRERAMIAPQTSGDCNGCHSQQGANAAPGRILLP